MRRLVLLTLARVLGFFLVGCAHNPFSATYGCTQVEPAETGFAGWTVMSCPHPFADPNPRTEACGALASRTGAPYGGDLQCGWTRAITVRDERLVLFWDRYPEALEHELKHVQTPQYIHEVW